MLQSFTILFKAKLVDFSRVAVSSPVVDVSYFLYSSVHPLLISEHYVSLLQVDLFYPFIYFLLIEVVILC